MKKYEEYTCQYPENVIDNIITEKNFSYCEIIFILFTMKIENFYLYFFRYNHQTKGFEKLTKYFEIRTAYITKKTLEFRIIRNVYIVMTAMKEYCCQTRTAFSTVYGEH